MAGEWIEEALSGKKEAMVAFWDAEIATKRDHYPYNPTAEALGVAEEEADAFYAHSDDQNSGDYQKAGVYGVLAVRQAQRRGFRGKFAYVTGLILNDMISVSCKFPEDVLFADWPRDLIAAVRVTDTFESRLLEGSLADAIFATRLDEDGMCRFAGKPREDAVRIEQDRRAVRERTLADLVALVERFKKECP